MAVPAHDERDREFALKYGIEIQTVVIAARRNGSPGKHGVHREKERQ